MRREKGNAAGQAFAVPKNRQGLQWSLRCHSSFQFCVKLVYVAFSNVAGLPYCQGQYSTVVISAQLAILDEAASSEMV